MYKCLGYAHVHTRIPEPLLACEHDSKAWGQYSKQNAWANHDPSKDISALWHMRISEKIIIHKQMLQIYMCICLQFQ